MDPLLVATRLPELAQRAMRAALHAALSRARVTPRALIDEALLRFERAVAEEVPEGVRPALLFAERDRIVRELRRFIDGRLAARLAAVKRRDLIAVGRRAAPFDAIVRNRRGAAYGVIFRRLPAESARLYFLRRVAIASAKYDKTPLRGVLVYDFSSGSARLVRDSRVTQAA